MRKLACALVLMCAPFAAAGPASAAVPASGGVSATAPSVSWQGGPVLQSSAPYLVYWDPSGNQTLAGWKPLLSQFLADSAADTTSSDNVNAVERQYWDGTG